MLRSVDDMSGSTLNNHISSRDKMQKNANNLSIYSNNNNDDVEFNNTTTASNVKKRQPQGEKIQSLKNQIEKQMKAYVKQEEYEEMLKLIKV